jgi:hypothetical protein
MYVTKRFDRKNFSRLVSQSAKPGIVQPKLEKNLENTVVKCNNQGLTQI